MIVVLILLVPKIVDRLGWWDFKNVLNFLKGNFARDLAAWAVLQADSALASI